MKYIKGDKYKVVGFTKKGKDHGVVIANAQIGDILTVYDDIGYEGKGEGEDRYILDWYKLERIGG